VRKRIAERPLAEYHPQVGALWRSRLEEPESEEFISLPEWMDQQQTDACDLADIKRLVGESLELLTNRELLVIKMRFWEEMTLAEVGEKLSVTPSRVREIEGKALRRLRAQSVRESLVPYTEWVQWWNWMDKKPIKKDRWKMSVRVEYPMVL
jgi:RNA polymerase sigma factor (sigma-70 family)